jgi:hypothetical protein
MVLLGIWGPWLQIVTVITQLITESSSAQLLDLGRVSARKSEVGCWDIPPQIPALRPRVNQAPLFLDFGLLFVLPRSGPCPKQGGETWGKRRHLLACIGVQVLRISPGREFPLRPLTLKVEKLISSPEPPENLCCSDDPDPDCGVGFYRL